MFAKVCHIWTNYHNTWNIFLKHQAVQQLSGKIMENNEKELFVKKLNVNSLISASTIQNLKC